MVERPSWRAGRGKEALLESWEGSGGQEEDRRPYQRAGRGREALLEEWEGMGSPPGEPGGVRRPS